eukprot:TRINITY_DN6658_c0_g4_i1.p1 TRINITY_DN6658_c0_g4~~TRINITY_DN6658_c0_g4_i1.p1  ORF type:complete len:346 (+),score=69.91 TRINITY_DN6658_c0_g4_i1:54-1091(+)
MTLAPGRVGFSINADAEDLDKRATKSLSYGPTSVLRGPPTPQDTNSGKGGSTRTNTRYGATSHSASTTPTMKGANPSPTAQRDSRPRNTRNPSPSAAPPRNPTKNEKQPLLSGEELPQGHSGDDKCRAVSAVIYKMIREGSRNPNPIFIEELDDRLYNYYMSGSTCCFCFGGSRESEYEVPEVKHIYVYIRKIMRATAMGLDVTIIGLVLLDRLVKKTGLTMSPSNWKPTVFACMLLASKAWGDDEVRFCNADLTYLTGVTDYALPDVNRLERKILELLQYDINVSSAIYANYYFGLLAHSKPKESTNFRTKFYARPSVATNIASRPKQQTDKPEGGSPELATTF